MRDNDENRYDLRDLLIGFIMLAVGAFLLLRNITVSSYGFASWFGSSSATGGIMIMVFVACFMVAIIRPHFITKSLAVISFVAIIVNVILGTRLTFQRISAVELVFMVMMFFGGLAFMLKVLFVPGNPKRRGNAEREEGGRDELEEAKRIEQELEEMKKRTRG